jgi:hypothetical protein
MSEAIDQWLPPLLALDIGHFIVAALLIIFALFRDGASFLTVYITVLVALVIWIAITRLEKLLQLLQAGTLQPTELSAETLWYLLIWACATLLALALGVRIFMRYTLKAWRKKF